MKPLLLVLFILLPILTMGQDNDVIAIFKGDTIYTGPTPILDLDLTCQHCIDEYQKGIKKETIRYTLTLKTNEIIIHKEGKVLEGKQIANAISSDIDDRFPLKQKLTIPLNTVSITFGYDGFVHSPHEKDSFSNYP